MTTDVYPTPIFAGFWSYQVTAALKAAIELDLFTAIAAGIATPTALAERCRAAVRGVRILSDYLTITGFLEKDAAAAEGHYRLAPATALFLDRAKPSYVGGAIDFLISREMLDLVLADPAGTVRAGGATGLANIAPENPVWVKFARAMEGWAVPTAARVVERVQSLGRPPKHVLDVSASHGRYGITFAQTFPDCAVTAVDWANVLVVARENAAAAGVAARFRFVEGDAFAVDWGGGFDLVLLPNFLHHFDRATCVSFLSRVRGALAPGGRVMIVEFVPNPDRVSPPDVAAFSYVMLTTTPSGDAYTEDEYRGMARDAGYARTELLPLEQSAQTLIELS